MTTGLIIALSFFILMAAIGVALALKIAHKQKIKIPKLSGLLPTGIVPEKFKVWWDRTEGSKKPNQDLILNTVWTVFWIAVCITTVNWICARSFSRWWLYLREHEAFWSTQLGILIATVGIITSKNGMWKFASYIVLIAAIIGVGAVVKDAPYRLKAGEWTRFDVPDGKQIRIITQYGIPFDYMFNDDGVKLTSGPNGEFQNFVKANIQTISIKATKDMTAKVILNNPK